jgi:hypothetical protein
MPKTFKIGEHVRWNSKAGRVSGIIVKKIALDMKLKATCITPRVKRHNDFIKSDETEHVATHKGAALRLIPPRARKCSISTATTRQRKR